MGPTLFKRIASDLTLPLYAFPFGVEDEDAGPSMDELLNYKLNFGLGQDRCSGVKPEAHEVSWFIEIKGRKRWVLTPPSQPVTGDSMRRRPPFGRCCEPRPERLAEGARVCDVPLGTMLYIPRGWWHETCGLDNYTMGIGGFPSPHNQNDGPFPVSTGPVLWPRLRKELLSRRVATAGREEAWSLQESEALVAVFDRFKSDSLSHQEFNDLLQAHGIVASGAELNQLFRFIDNRARGDDNRTPGMISARELFWKMGEAAEGTSLPTGDDDFATILTELNERLSELI